MPELPEVEITRRGVAPAVLGARVERVIVREQRLRWPVPAALRRDLPGSELQDVRRRAKFLLFDTGAGSMIVHLGMSGRLRVVPHDLPVRKHDHVDICFDNGHRLRFHDPRRFGSVLWTRRDPLRHRLLSGLGPEPLEDPFDGVWLYRQARGRRVGVKQFVMNPAVVVGVGNIYASEALFRAGIHPRRPAGRISEVRMTRLAESIREVLGAALEVGGTTLRDFVGGDGEPGYFQLQLNVYGRHGQPCPQCGDEIRREVMGQRSTFFCRTCQR